MESEKGRKLKQQEERSRKNKVAQATAKNTTGDNRLGGDNAGGGFNPMQPWTGSTGGYRYVYRIACVCVCVYGYSSLLSFSHALLYSLFPSPDRAQRRSARRG
jgi:hypothetical protein